jgi:predicted pyridoxine 5'-phosphate oxidase superfamily flavin-nucleotide-binding protein
LLAVAADKRYSLDTINLNRFNPPGPHMLTDDILKYIDRSILCWLATIDADGAPNVSPKEVFVASGRDALLVANIASPNTVRNIAANPRVCVSFVDVFVQKGYKLCGTAEVIQAGTAMYDEVVKPLEVITQGKFKIHSVINILISKAESIVAPSYRMFPRITEAAQITAAMHTYGVAPKEQE